MRLKHEHVHQSGLSMVKVTDDSNVANHFGEGCHIQQESRVLFSVKGMN
jgi:hypothetical protein